MSVYVQRFNLVVPEHAAHNAGLRAALALPAAAGEHDKVQVFSGTQAVQNYGVSVIGSGATASGTIKGTLTSYDYKAIYQVYDLKDTESANYWFVSYSKSTSHDELVKAAESSKTLTISYDVNFTLTGNDYGVTAVYITFQVIRLVINGVTRDYTVANPPSAGAANPDGSPYVGGFKAIPPAGG